MQGPQSVTHGQFMSAQTPMQFGSSPGQGQFLGMTTMQMQQQLLQQQQQQQQLQQQQLQQQQQHLAQNTFNQAQPQVYGQMFPQGGYSAQGAQWGPV